MEHHHLYPSGGLNNMRRRDFISAITKTAGGMALLSVVGMAQAAEPKHAGVTVGEIMDAFISQVPGAPFAETVDTLKAGSRDMQVTGVVTTMFATVEVIKKSISLGANFIIAHEPTFYNHEDNTDWLQNDAVYQYKRKLLQENNIAVWRNHDYVHSLVADGVYSGVIDQLGWRQYNTTENMLHIPQTSLQQLIQHIKTKLGVAQLRYIGNPKQTCSKVLLIPGAAGGNVQITAISKQQPDVLVCGEIHEWETAEYVRDARAQGRQLSLIVTGHIASEEPGSIFMQGWVNKNFPGIKTTHVAAGNSLSFA